MKKYLPLIIIIGAILLIGLWFMNIKNGAITINQATEKEWGNVETAYQRRNDLIGNLVNTVKGVADFEKSTLTAVVEARSKATSVNVDAKNLNANDINRFNQAQTAVNSSLSRLLVSVEKYPELKATENFKQLQDELASTENQILTARTRFNEAVQGYNTYILKIPNSWFLGEYKTKSFFTSVAGADKPVEVKF
ncbi:MAG: LemA family protein [Flavobacterium sp. BFFFF2]|nr:MAG: LemA family protein [Flavobacterium sp. BFFFF2]